MDIAQLSVVMNQSKVQTAAGIAIMKIAMNDRKENAAQMTETISNCVTDPNLGNNLDVSG